MKPETVEAKAFSFETVQAIASSEHWPDWITNSDIRRVLDALTTTPEYQEMVKDAERYRWLRTQDPDDEPAIWVARTPPGGGRD